MAGATRPVGGGAYSSPRSEPGGQNTPRAGRVVASYGTYISALGLFAQQVDQGSIFDDTADAAAIVTATGSSTETYDGADSNSATTTAGGTGTDSYAASETRTGTITATGTGTESYSTPVTYTDTATGTLTATGSGSDSYGVLTYYDTVIDVDSPVSHWKLGDTATAVDRKGVLNLPAVSGPIGSTPGLIANNASDLASLFTPTGQSFSLASSPGIGISHDTPTWTLEAWVSRSAAVAMNLVDYANKASIVVFAGRFTFDGYDLSGTGKRINSVAPLGNVGVGVLHHVVLTYNGTDLIAYIDSVEAGRIAMPNSRSLPDVAPRIAGSGDTDGVIDEAAWYPTALTAARVLAHYQAGTIPAGTVYTDTGSGTLTATGTATEAAAYTDSATAPLTATGSSTGTRSYTDTAVGTATTSGTGTDSWTTSTSYTDSQSGAITSSGSGTETAAANDAATGTATSSGSGVESHADTATAAGTATTSGTGTESTAATDAGTATTTATGTGLETRTHADTATGQLTLTGTGTDDYQLGATTYTDTATGTLTTTGTSLEAHASSDSAAGQVTATGTGLDSYLPGPTVHTDTASGTVTSTGTGVENYQPATTHTGTGTGTTTSTGTGVEAYTYTDASAGLLTLTGTSAESYGYTDSSTAETTISGSGLEDRTYTDSTLGLLHLTGTGISSSTPRQLAISTITLNQPTYTIAIQNGNMATTLTAAAAPTIRIIATPSITTSIQPLAPIAVELDRIA